MANAKVKPSFQEYDASGLKLGMKFTAPLYFDDGENMFLAENCAIKPYHLLAVKQWGINVLLTFGKPASDSPGFESARIPRGVSPSGAAFEKLEELEELNEA